MNTRWGNVDFVLRRALNSRLAGNTQPNHILRTTALILYKTFKTEFLARRVADPLNKSYLGDPPTFLPICFGDLIPLPNFLKLHLVRGFYPKLVRGERSKMRGSNTEIVWQRARTPDGTALHP